MDLSSATTVMAAKIDLSGSFQEFWDILKNSTGMSGILSLLQVIGVAIVVGALVKWVWDRRRGGGMGNSGAIWGSLLVGALLSSPILIIPIALTFLDAVVNFAVEVYNRTAG